MNLPTETKNAQRLALDAMVKDYQARGGKAPRYRMVRRRHEWMSIPKSAKHRVLRYADLIPSTEG